jgi:hypothetical protein
LLSIKKGGTNVKERVVWIGISSLLLGVILLLVAYYCSPADSLRRFALQSLSIALFPIGFIALLERLYLESRVSGRVVSELSKELYKNFDEYGVKFLHRPKFNYSLIFDQAERGAKIVILDTYIPTFSMYADSMKRALERECEIKFLVIQRSSLVLGKRALEIAHEAFTKESINSGVESYLNTIAKTAKSAKALDRVFAVEYDDLPCMPIYLIKQAGNSESERAGKSKVYFSFFLNTASINVPHFEVDYREQGLFPLFEKYLTSKWKRNKDKAVPLKELAEQGTSEGG